MTDVVAIAMALFALYWLAILLLAQTPLGDLADRVLRWWRRR